ncbi:MAG TPA: guanylate kinase [Candidatus Baltobacteraceae bacterium]|jgi:guanylate kinase|nr:guanylate kinase [Candidatus Baltobacteraceae bacterium]
MSHSQPQKEPLVLIVSGPSGSGKSTLVQKILELPGTLLAVSCTTRAPRKTESAGKWYTFISEAEFQQMVARGEFLEHAQVFGKNWYGTPRKWLDEALAQKKDLVLEIDVQGALQVKGKLPRSVAIFVLPPSAPDLERRIRERGQDSEDEIRRRLERARQEILNYNRYDFTIVNDDLERAGREVQAIALASRCLTPQKEERIREILKSFGG